jgi:hypothetical protein
MPVGLWRVRDLGPGVSINGLPPQGGSHLAADSSHRWRVDFEGDSRSGTVPRHDDIPPLERNSLLELFRQSDAGRTWASWCDQTPVAPGLEDILRIQQLEKAAFRELPHVWTVCARPVTHLNVESERLPLSVAKRISNRAPEVLASHTEDWERPTLWAVEPKRILAEFRYEELNTYENRLTARLVDALLLSVNRRIHAVCKALEMLEERSDYQNLARGTWRRAERILELWAETLDADEAKKVGLATRKVLLVLRQRLLTLMDTPLYRAIPGDAKVHGALKTTNLLTHHQHYRRVALLWGELAAARGTTAITSEAFFELQQRTHGAFDSFCALCVVRALDQLGYEPEAAAIDSTWGPGSAITLNHEFLPGSASLEWTANGVLRLTSDDGASLRIVPVAANLRAAPASLTDTRLRAMSSWSADAIGPTVVLYPGQDTVEPGDSSNDPRLATVGNEPALGLPAGLGFLMASPWDIASVERVARAIRYYLQSGGYLRYPAVVDLDVAAVFGGTLPAWAQTASSGIRVREPGSDPDRIAQQIRDRAAEIREVSRQARSEEAKYRDIEDKAKGYYDKSKPAHKQRMEQKEAAEAAEAILERISDAPERLAREIGRLNALAHCPVCPEVATTTTGFTSVGDLAYRCICPSCSARWDIRSCECGNRYPTLIPHDASPDVDSSTGWVDREIGCDVLAVPLAGEDGFKFICPACGACN